MKALRSFASYTGILVFASLAGAQTSTESKLHAAVKLLASGTLYFEINGYQTIGNKTTTLKDTLFWYSIVEDGKTVYKAELIQTRNNLMERRLVADGELAWMFNFTRHEYSVSNYSANAGTQVERLMGFLQANTGGPGAYNARLLREAIVPIQGVDQRSWLPGHALISIDTPTKDPLTGVVYTPADNVEYLAYGLDREGTTRTLVYELDSNETSTYLSKITYADFPNRKADRSTVWTMSILTGPTLDMTRFLPEPQATLSTWRPIASAPMNQFKSGR